MILFVVFLFLAAYNAGCMTTPQIQHYGIYPAVGKENFAAYMQANNRAAVLPTILPTMLLLLVSLALVFSHPGFMRPYEAIAALGLNLVAFASTMVWQRRNSRRDGRHWLRRAESEHAHPDELDQDERSSADCSVGDCDLVKDARGFAELTMLGVARTSQF